MRLWHLAALGFNSDEAVYAGQGASIAGDAALRPFFPIFRAHPLLYQTALSFGFLLGGGDRFGRVFRPLSVSRRSSSRTRSEPCCTAGAPAVLAAMFLALMPYHVLISGRCCSTCPRRSARR